MRKLDQGILLVLFLLLGIGLVQVYSSSFIFATESRGDGLFFFKRQLTFTLVAISVLIAVANFPWRWIEKSALAFWAFATMLLLLTFVPGIGSTAGGATRWIRLPLGVNFEPSELVKVAFPLALATFLNRDWREMKPVQWGCWLLALFTPLLMMLKQPDFGSFAICTAVFLCLLFVFGLRWRYILAGITVVIPAFYILVMMKEYRRARVLAFLDPWQDPAQKGFQVIQSMLSFHSGGLTGVGLGQGQGKLFFLPESHTDFTLAVLGEETGFLGVLVVMMLFGYLLFRGFQIAFQTEDRFAKATALGMAVVLTLAVIINAGVATGLLPTKGLTLPFLSYGGSSLFMTCFAVGVLLNIQKQNETLVKAHATSQVWQSSKIKIREK